MLKWKPAKATCGPTKDTGKINAQVHVTNLVKSSESTVPMINTDPPTDPDERWQFVLNHFGGPRWQSGNTLASHLCGRGSIPVMAVSGKAGSYLPLVGSLQYTTLANSMYWFPLPFQLPVVI